MAEEVSDWKPICVASTQGNDDTQSPGPNAERPGHENSGYSGANYFKSAQWFVSYSPPAQMNRRLICPHWRSPDGTTLLTDSADHHIRTFIL